MGFVVVSIMFLIVACVVGDTLRVERYVLL